MDWGTRRKPLGAIVAWASLAVFAVLTIMGIAGVVMTLQPRQAATTTETAAIAAPVEAAPVEERLPEELSFADAQAVATEVSTTPGDDLIASTFDQLVEPAAAAAPAVTETAAVTGSDVELPLSAEEAATVTAALRPSVNRNAAAWAIESEVPDSNLSGTALGYAAAPDEQVVVGDSRINVRTGPSQDNKRLFALSAGSEVDVDGQSDGWVSITDERGREGWVDATLLDNLDLGDVPVVADPPAAEPAAPANLKTVAGSGVTVRSGPGKSNRALFNLSGGSKVSVLESSQGWLKVQDNQGRTGWAYQSFVR